jgi:hypothetical protein
MMPATGMSRSQPTARRLSQSNRKGDAMIRAKFRCMDCTRTWNKYITYKFYPVMASDGAPENAQFWEATPSGEAEMNFYGEGEHFVVGDYYYIDMEPAEGRDWEMHSVTDHGQGHKSAHFSFNPKTKNWNEPGPRRGSLKMDVENPAAFVQFGSAGAPWSVKFIHAQVSDYEF